jgi:hypothetical protein
MGEEKREEEKRKPLTEALRHGGKREEGRGKRGKGKLCASVPS